MYTTRLSRSIFRVPNVLANEVLRVFNDTIHRGEMGNVDGTHTSMAALGSHPGGGKRERTGQRGKQKSC